MSTQTKTWTEAELLALKHDGYKCELVNGEIEMSPAGFFDHGDIIALLMSRLTVYIYEKKLGKTFDGQSGCWMKSGNLRCADISFLSKSRIDGLHGRPKGYFHGAPDLAVEVLSPNETAKQVAEKLADYFESGAQLVWIVNPADKTVTVYRSLVSLKVLRPGDALDGEDIVPGFSMPVVELFAQSEFD